MTPNRARARRGEPLHRRFEVRRHELQKREFHVNIRGRDPDRGCHPMKWLGPALIAGAMRKQDDRNPSLGSGHAHFRCIVRHIAPWP